MDIKSVAQLKRRIRKVWRELEPELLEKLVLDVKFRIQELLAANTWTESNVTQVSSKLSEADNFEEASEREQGTGNRSLNWVSVIKT